MISKSLYERLEQKFGKEYSSWAIWSPPSNGEFGTNNTNDISVFQDGKLLEKLTVDFVLVGLNAAKHDGNYLTHEPWKAFHSDDMRKQKDYKLRYALHNTNIWGAYLTDVIKGFNCSNSVEVKNNLKKHPDEYKKQIEKFKNELDIIRDELNGRNPVVIAIGNETFRILDKNKKKLGLNEIKKITHYSYRFNGCSNIKFYRDRVHRELSGTIKAWE